MTGHRSQCGRDAALLDRVLLPALVATAGVMVDADGLAWPWSSRMEAGAVVGAVVLAVCLYAQCFSPIGRLRLALMEYGVASHDETGAAHGPRLRGLPQRRPFGWHLTYALPRGVSFEDFTRAQVAVEHRTVSELYGWMSNGRMHLDMYTAVLPDVVPFADFYAQPAPPGVVAGLGISRRGPLYLDFRDTPHLLVGGITGGGKSNALRAILAGLTLRYDPSHVRIVCIDLKGGVELHRFAQLPHALTPLADDVESAADALHAVDVEMHRRLMVLRQAGASSFEASAELRRTAPRLVVVCDELAELLDPKADGGHQVAGAKLQRGYAARVLTGIARLGRAASVSVIAATQRPDSEAITPQFRAQLGATLAYRCRDDINSRILLGNDRAALLPPHPGRAIWQYERPQEMQTVLLGEDECARLLDERQGTALVTRCPQPTSSGAQPTDGEESA